MATFTIGKIRPVYKGVYNSATTYNYLDFARYNGTLWITISTEPIQGITPVEGSVWQPFGVKGEKGDTGDTGAKGDTGDTGNGIARAVLNADYTLTLTFTNGDTYTTTSIRGATGAAGAKGDKGDTGDTGPQGASVTGASINSSGELVITIS